MAVGLPAGSPSMVGTREAWSGTAVVDVLERTGAGRGGLWRSASVVSTASVGDVLASAARGGAGEGGLVGWSLRVVGVSGAIVLSATMWYGAEADVEGVWVVLSSVGAGGCAAVFGGVAGALS